jgi:hypothetical protein
MIIFLHKDYRNVDVFIHLVKMLKKRSGTGRLGFLRRVAVVATAVRNVMILIFWAGGGQCGRVTARDKSRFAALIGTVGVGTILELVLSFLAEMTIPCHRIYRCSGGSGGSGGIHSFF